MADDLQSKLKEVFDKSGLKGKAAKDALREFVATNWPDLPPWSTLPAPEIKEVATATVGSGVALVFEDFGSRKVVLAAAGSHYGKGEGKFMIPGGFINLTDTPGSSQVAAAKKTPEDGRIGAAREIEEELKLPDGSPLLKVDPARLKPMDTKTLALRGETRLVIGFVLELTPHEINVVKAHVLRLQSDAKYKDATSEQSNNHESGQPEVSGVSIFPLAEVAAGKVDLMHKDQQSLFAQVESHYGDIDKAVKAAKHNYPSIH